MKSNNPKKGNPVNRGTTPELVSRVSFMLDKIKEDPSNTFVAEHLMAAILRLRDSPLLLIQNKYNHVQNLLEQVNSTIAFLNNSLNRTNDVALKNDFERKLGILSGIRDKHLMPLATELSESLSRAHVTQPAVTPSAAAMQYVQPEITTKPGDPDDEIAKSYGVSVSKNWHAVNPKGWGNTQKIMQEHAKQLGENPPKRPRNI